MISIKVINYQEQPSIYPYLHINITHFTNLRPTIKRYRQNSVECRYKKDSHLHFHTFISSLPVKSLHFRFLDGSYFTRETYCRESYFPDPRLSTKLYFFFSHSLSRLYKRVCECAFNKRHLTIRSIKQHRRSYGAFY